MKTILTRFSSQEMSIRIKRINKRLKNSYLSALTGMPGGLTLEAHKKMAGGTLGVQRVGVLWNLDQR